LSFIIIIIIQLFSQNIASNNWKRTYSFTQASGTTPSPAQNVSLILRHSSAMC